MYMSGTYLKYMFGIYFASIWVVILGFRRHVRHFFSLDFGAFLARNSYQLKYMFGIYLASIWVVILGIQKTR